MRNYREEIETALRGEAPAAVPFTIYDSGIIPPGFELAPLQARGLALHVRPPLYEQHTAEVQGKTVTEPGGIVRSVLQTPVGELTYASRAAALGHKTIEHPIKSLDDYHVAEYIVEHTSYVPAYDKFLAARAEVGDAGIAVAHGPYSPLVDLQLWWLGQEQFCYEILDHEDVVLSLYEKMVRKHHELFALMAASPARYLTYCGNVVPEMIGPQRIRQYVLPCWRELADMLHAEGKLLGSHLDADNRQMMDSVADSGFDFIEAFTPPPEGSISVAEAKVAWPGKRLWVNFPSSVTLFSDEEIRVATREMLAQAGDRRGFLFGITEDIPADQMQRSLSCILDVLEEEGVR